MAKTNTAVQSAQENKPVKTAKSLFEQQNVRDKFNEILGKKSIGFITSVLQCTAQNSSLAKADPNSILQSAMIAATLDLPINPNLGFAYIIPYEVSYKNEQDQWAKKQMAQFQVGWRGFVQLAQRSGQYKKINVTEVYENQFVSYNSLTEELIANFDVDGDGAIVGYASYFELLNGFEKTTYWTIAKVKAHAMKYSQAYKSERGKTPWKDVDQFHEMAKKTVLKNSLSKWGPLSIEMQTAMKTDQSVIKDASTQETEDIEYVDHQPLQLDPAETRLLTMIEDCKSIDELEPLKSVICSEETQQAFNSKYHELGGK